LPRQHCCASCWGHQRKATHLARLPGMSLSTPGKHLAQCPTSTSASYSRVAAAQPLANHCHKGFLANNYSFMHTSRTAMTACGKVEHYVTLGDLVRVIVPILSSSSAHFGAADAYSCQLSQKMRFLRQHPKQRLRLRASLYRDKEGRTRRVLATTSARRCVRRRLLRGFMRPDVRGVRGWQHLP
jgi:hypothetical protein